MLSSSRLVKMSVVEGFQPFGVREDALLGYMIALAAETEHKSIQTIVIVVVIVIINSGNRLATICSRRSVTFNFPAPSQCNTCPSAQRIHSTSQQRLPPSSLQHVPPRSPSHRSRRAACSPRPPRSTGGPRLPPSGRGARPKLHNLPRRLGSGESEQHSHPLAAKAARYS